MFVIHVKNGFIINRYSGITIDDLRAAIGGQGGEFFETDSDVKTGSEWPLPEPVESEPEPEPEPYYLKPRDVVSWAGQKIEEAMADIPSQERLTWDTQVEEAQAVLRDSGGLTILLSAQSSVTNESVEDLASKVLQKAAELSAFSGFVIGIRRTFLSRIEAGEEIEVEALDAALIAAQEVA